MKNYLQTLIRLTLLGCLALGATTGTALAGGDDDNLGAIQFNVNTTVDANDAVPGNNICEATAGAGDCTLRAAITEANFNVDPNVINIPAGTYTQSLVGADNTNAAGDFDILSSVTIIGAGSGGTIIQSNAASGVAVERVIHFINATAATTVAASLSGVTVRNGRTAVNTFGAGVRVESSSATAILNVTVNNCLVRDNVAQGRGSGFYSLGAGTNLIVNDTVVTANLSTNTTATATNLGGAVYITAGTTTYNRSVITNNTTAQAATAAAPLASAFGGGVTAAGGTLNFNNSLISGNTATSSVAAGSFGGGIAISAGTVNLTDSTVSNNTASFTGTGTSANVGGIDNEQGTLNLTRTTVSGNTAGSTGGIRTLSSTIAATTTLNQSAVVNNSTPNIGGIFNIAVGAAAATTTINNSTIGGNSSNLDGGGVENYTTGAGNAVTNINYSTVASNTADADGNVSGNGGGLANFGQAGSGTGVGTINLLSSVVANNVNVGNSSADITNTITSLGYNLVENTTGGTFTVTTGDAVGIDPALGALGLNGGTTVNYLPNAGSPLLNAIPIATNQCGTAPFNVDQKNVNRPFPPTGACDKGASERGLVIVTPSNGLPAGRQGVLYSATLTANFGTPPYVFTLASGTPPPGLTVNTDGTITGTPTTPGSYFFSVQVTDATLLRFAPSAVQVKQFQIVVLAPNAASVTVGGRVLVGRRGIANVVVTMTDQNGATRSARTTSTGYYRFDEVSAGADYVFQAAAKRYSFDPQVVTVVEGRDDLNFAAGAAQK